MDSFDPFVIILFLGGGIFALAGWIQQRYPPKKINHLYGYRTRRSMMSQERWDFSQQLSAQKMTFTGTAMVLLAGFFFLLEIRIPHPWGFGLAMVLLVALPFRMFFQVEQALKKHFPPS